MVKAGVYLLMRLNPVLGDTVWWETILPVFGGATLIVGTLLAIRQTDLKLMLAYTTVSSLGLLVMLTGLRLRTCDFRRGALSGGALAVQGRIVHGRGPDRP
jgi:NADH:ubiquinone oxidoreductase subunit 5 (subunit L)/multisubunit Na+/H+ antiporter MnhA subunit